MKNTCIIYISATLLLSHAALGMVLISETFNGGTTPDGWSAHTYTGGSHTTLGTLRDDSFRFPNAGDDGYLRLTESSNYQHTTLINTQTTFNTNKSFSFTADVRISGSGGGADGLSFFWVSKASVDQVAASNSNVDGIQDISGGAGEWQGAPHGNNPSMPVGYYEGISGYSFEFDHYKNSGEYVDEYNHFIRLDDWDHSAGSVAAADRNSDDTFYWNNGWIRTHFNYDEDSETFSYYLEALEGAEAGAVTATTTFSIAELATATDEVGWYQGFDEAYFGIGAATGGLNAEHLVDNVEVIPEPATAGIIAEFALIVFLWLRRRSR